MNADTVVATAKKYSPWAAPWWVALIQGLLALALGIYLYLNAATASTVLGQFLALYLLISGLFDILAGLRRKETSTAAQIAYYKGIAGAVIGGLLIVLLFFGWLGPNGWLSVGTGFMLLGLGLLIYGVLGLYLAYQKQRGNGRLLSLISSILFLAIGIVAVFFRDSNVLGQWIAPVLVVLGVGLLIMAYVRYSQAHSPAEQAA